MPTNDRKQLTQFEKGLCRRLKATREALGLTQSSVGESVGLTNVRISHYETGQRQPSLENLIKLAQALDVTTDHLLGVD